MNNKILVVEDDLLTAEGIMVSLQKFDFKIVGNVGTGDDAIHIVETNPPDIILMDINLFGDKSGIDTAIEIKEKYDIPVIFITGYCDKETVAKSKAAAPYGFIVKPIEFYELKIAVEIALHKHAMNKRILELEKQKHLQDMIVNRNQRLSSLGELSASIAHEIRQPLQVIMVITESILYWYKNNPDTSGILHKHLMQLEKVVNNAERINGIIIQLQDLVKKDNRDIKKQININTNIHRVLSFYDQKVKHHAITLKLSLSDTLTDIVLSEVAFEQILINIIKNSIDAHDTSDKMNKFIEIKTGMHDHNIILEVIDNATGIDEKNFEKILNPLFTTKTKTESMGLGLFIINNLIQANNGTLEYSNNDYGGATFIITFRKDIV